MMIPFYSFKDMHDPIREEVLDAFASFYDRRWYVLGKGVNQFESDFAQFTGSKFCVGVGNGLDALHIALKTLDIGAGDEVIVPSNTYIATWLAVSFVGATIVPVEPDENTYNIDPLKIEQAVTPNTRAIIPVHLYGQACDMDGVMAVARRHNLYVVEDNAQAQGSTFKSVRTGNFGDINGVSFYPGKNIGALGEAGAITTDNEHLADKARMLRNYGSKEKYYNELIGYNARLDEFQAEVVSIKLKYLENWNEQRRQIASWYNEYLNGIEGIITPSIHPDVISVFHQYIIRSNSRDQLKLFLDNKGIGTMIHYPVPPHLQKAYQGLGYKKGDFPITENISNTVLSLPVFPGLSKSEVEYVCENIWLFQKHST